jgi:outer membrane murein-binding lipoprotein Lpp
MSDTAPAAEAPAAPADTQSPAPPADGQTPAAAAPAPEAPKQPEKVSPQVAALMRQQRELRRQQEAFEKERTAFGEEAKKAAARRALKDQDVTRWLEEEGISYEALTKRILGGGAPTGEEKTAAEIKAAREEAERAKSEIEALKKSMEEKETASRTAEAQRLEREWWADGEKKLQAEGKAYAFTLNHPDGMDTLREYVNAQAAQTGKIPDLLQCAKDVEAAMRQRIEPVLKSEWAKDILGPATPKPEASAASESGPRSAVRTLSNTHAAAPRAPREPSQAERRKAAIDYLTRKA